MPAPDVTQVLDEQRAKYGNDADNDGSPAETHGAIAVDFRTQFLGADYGVGTQDDETDAK